MAKDRLADYDSTAASNTDVGGIDIDENCSPANINNAIREVMSHLADFHGDVTGGTATTNSGNDYSLTTNDGVSAYAAGQLYAFACNAANTGAATLDVNTIGAKDLEKAHDVALESGDLEANGVYIVAYNATDDTFQLLTQVAKAAHAQGTQEIPVSATAITPAVSTGKGCGAVASYETTSGRPDIIACAFDKDSDEFGQFMIPMPKQWDQDVITFKPHWTFQTGSATQTVHWNLQAVAVGNDESVDQVYGTAQSSSDIAIAAEDVHTGPASSNITVGNTPAAGDLVFFQIFRDVSEDDLAGDALLLGLTIYVTTDKANDA